MKYDLNGRAVLITGSTGGLGNAVAEALRAKGAKLALLDINAAVLEAQASELGGADVARAWEADVQSLESIEAAMAEAARHFGGIDVVIANAGIDTVRSMATMEPKMFERVIDINLNGVWRTFRAALPFVQPRKGYLMAISSMAAFVHSPLQAHYTASKAGVWALCDSIRLELRHFGVGVGSVHPTFFRTPMMAEVHADAAGRKLWAGNEKGLWKMIPIETVVAAIVDGIETRRDFIVAPKQNTIVAKAPGLFRRFVEHLGFKDADITEAIRSDAGAGGAEIGTPGRNSANVLVGTAAPSGNRDDARQTLGATRHDPPLLRQAPKRNGDVAAGDSFSYPDRAVTLSQPKAAPTL